MFTMHSEICLVTNSSGKAEIQIASVIQLPQPGGIRISVCFSNLRFDSKWDLSGSVGFLPPIARYALSILLRENSDLEKKVSFQLSQPGGT